MPEFPNLVDGDRHFAQQQVRLLAEHFEGDEIDYGFVAKHALALLQIAEFSWESPFRVVQLDAKALTCHCDVPANVTGRHLRR